MLLDQRFGRLCFSRRKYNLKCNVTFWWLVHLFHWEMVLVRTKLNREYVVYLSGVNHPTDPHLLDLVHDTPHFKSSSHTPYAKSRSPTPLIETRFLNGQIETRFTNHLYWLSDWPYHVTVLKYTTIQTIQTTKWIITKQTTQSPKNTL